MSKDNFEKNDPSDLGIQLELLTDKMKNMTRRELEEAILIEIKAIQSDLRVILEDKRPKIS